MKSKVDIEKREVEIKLSEQELRRVFKDLNDIDSVDNKTTLKFIKELGTSVTILDFIIKSK